MRRRSKATPKTLLRFPRMAANTRASSLSNYLNHLALLFSVLAPPLIPSLHCFTTFVDSSSVSASFCQNEGRGREVYAFDRRQQLTRKPTCLHPPPKPKPKPRACLRVRRVHPSYVRTTVEMRRFPLNLSFDQTCLTTIKIQLFFIILGLAQL